MIVKTNGENDCEIVLGAREAVELFGDLCAGAVAGIAEELQSRLLVWLENELIFDKENNPNRIGQDK